MKRYLRTENFTLIELLVVIAIIAILASMLLPSLNKARDRAKTIACTSNEKQIGTAMMMYVDSQQGYFPVADASSYTSWDNALSAYDGRSIPDNYTHLVLSTSNVNKTQPLYRCPSDIIPRNSTNYARSYALSYYCESDPYPRNSGISGCPTTTFNLSLPASRKISRIRKPSTGIALLEYPNVNNIMGRVGATNGIYSSIVGINYLRSMFDSTVPVASFWVHDSRKAKMNFLFADGHSEYLSFADTCAPYNITNTGSNNQGTLWDVAY